MSQVCFIIVLFLIPVLDIFRFDSDTRQLIVFGRAWSLGLAESVYSGHSPLAALHVTARILLKAVLPWLLFLGLFPLLGFLFGRFFCGWLCPEGALFELADSLTLGIAGRRNIFSRTANDPKLPGKQKPLYILLAVLSAVIIPFIGAVSLSGYFVAPKTVFAQLATGDFTFGVKAGMIGVSLYMLITSIFVRHALCRFVCAAGLMQMLFGWISPVSLRLNMDTARISRCTDCKRCEKACFMNIAPRKHKRDISCVNCGACVDACDGELGKGKGLFCLRFGSGRRTLPLENCRPLRPRPNAKI